jgi:hypothetical protein
VLARRSGFGRNGEWQRIPAVGGEAVEGGREELRHGTKSLRSGPLRGGREPGGRVASG